MGLGKLSELQVSTRQALASVIFTETKKPRPTEAGFSLSPVEDTKGNESSFEGRVWVPPGPLLCRLVENWGPVKVDTPSYAASKGYETKLCVAGGTEGGLISSTEACAAAVRSSSGRGLL